MNQCLIKIIEIFVFLRVFKIEDFCNFNEFEFTKWLTYREHFIRNITITYFICCYFIANIIIAKYNFCHNAKNKLRRDWIFFDFYTLNDQRVD